MSDALRYAVLDSDGVKVNGILVNDPYPQDYWPGYGAYITCEYGEPDPTPPENLELRPGFNYLLVRPTERFDIGDTMNLETGEVTQYVSPEEQVS